MTNTACVCWSQHASCGEQHSVTVGVNSNPVCCAPHTHKSSQITINRERTWYNSVLQTHALQVRVFNLRIDQHLTKKAGPNNEPVLDTSRLKHLPSIITAPPPPKPYSDPLLVIFFGHNSEQLSETILLIGQQRNNHLFSFRFTCFPLKMY